MDDYFLLRGQGVLDCAQGHVTVQMILSGFPDGDAPVEVLHLVAHECQMLVVFGDPDKRDFCKEKYFLTLFCFVSFFSSYILNMCGRKDFYKEKIKCDNRKAERNEECDGCR